MNMPLMCRRVSRDQYTGTTIAAILMIAFRRISGDPAKAASSSRPMEPITITGPGDLYELETGQIPPNREPVFTFTDRAAAVQVLRILGQDLRAEVDALIRVAADFGSARKTLLAKPAQRPAITEVMDQCLEELRTRQTQLIDIQRWLDAAIVAADAGSMSRNAIANHTGFTLAIVAEFLDGDDEPDSDDEPDGDDSPAA